MRELIKHERRLEKDAFSEEFKVACVNALCSHMGVMSLPCFLQRLMENDPGADLHEATYKWLELHVMDATFMTGEGDLTMLGLAAMSARPEFHKAVDEIIESTRFSPWPRHRRGSLS